MKKLILLLGATTALAASAINPPKQLHDRYTRIIPNEFTTDGQAVLTAEIDDAIIAYNNELDVIATVNVPKSTQIEYTNWTQRRKWAPKTVTLISTEQTGNAIQGYTWDAENYTYIPYYPQTLEDVMEWYNNDNRDAPIVDTLDGETIIVGEWFFANFGQKYIERFYRFNDGAWREYRNEYEKSDWGNYGEWDEVDNWTDTCSSGEICDIEVDMNGVAYVWFALSQTLFNSDSQFEYVYAKLEKLEFTHETESERSGGEKVMVTGYSIMSQNGNKLFDIAIPAEYQQDDMDTDVCIYILGDKRYFVIRSNGGYNNSTEDYCLFYELDSKGGIKAPKVVKSAMSVSPATPRHGETVMVDLGIEVTSATMVNIVSANGSTVRSLPISAGQRNISLSTAGLASGLYVVSANGHEAAKIIIR